MFANRQRTIGRRTLVAIDTNYGHPVFSGVPVPPPVLQAVVLPNCAR
jgi:hypothetical protein